MAYAPRAARLAPCAPATTTPAPVTSVGVVLVVGALGLDEPRAHEDLVVHLKELLLQAQDGAGLDETDLAADLADLAWHRLAADLGHGFGNPCGFGVPDKRERTFAVRVRVRVQ